MDGYNAAVGLTNTPCEHIFERLNKVELKVENIIKNVPLNSGATSITSKVGTTQPTWDGGFTQFF